MSLANEPLVALYSLLPFILRKDLGATLFQVSLFITLRPVLSVFSFYWSASLSYQKNKLLSNLMGACILAHLPFLFFPVIDNFWFILFACAVYQLFSKAGTPALIEILKRNIPKKPREHIFSLYFILSFIESGVLGYLIGNLLDKETANWKVLVFSASLIGLSSLFLQRRVTVSSPEEELPIDVPPSRNWLLTPWKESFALMRNRPDFAHFQWGFMIGGSALMLMAPAFSVFYADTLSLSHTTIAIARFVFMAIGVAGSSLLWKRGLGDIQLHRFTGLVLVGFALFPLALLLAQVHLNYLYLAFFLYGVAQAGSHLLWNLSGTLFALDQDSSPFTAVNILMLGLRGIVMPLLGGLLCSLWGPVPVLVLGMSLCFLGVVYMMKKPIAQIAKASS